MDLLNNIKFEIVYHVKSDLSNEEKKKKVDDYIKAYIAKNFVSSNSIVMLLVNVLIQYEPFISQFVFNLLKDRIDGLTKEG